MISKAKGFKTAAVHSGIRDRLDLALIYSEFPCSLAGTATQNIFAAAPVLYFRELLKHGRAQAVIVNSGNANACTGPDGYSHVLATAEHTARALGIRANDVVVASTGVIGVPLPINAIISHLNPLKEQLHPDNHTQAATAIMTTDTRIKETMATVTLSTGSSVIGAIAKGSGMIAPNMATMLCFIGTDASISSHDLQQALSDAVEVSFNMISVDHCTSTNDMVVALANGASRTPPIKQGTSDYTAFKNSLTTVCTTLAKQIAADGEGATKLIEVTVQEAPALSTARMLVHQVINSPLVKTAIFGEDPNWGRILQALGQNHQLNVDPTTTELSLGGVILFKKGGQQSYTSSQVNDHLRGNEIRITVNLGSGCFSATGWGCDLSYDYVKINAKYN